MLPIQINLVITLIISLLILYTCKLSLKQFKGKDLSHSLKVERENITCKDGFCTLPIQNEDLSIQKNKVNLFILYNFKNNISSKVLKQKF